MQNLINKGDLKIGPLIMKQMAKKWFDTYSDAEISPVMLIKHVHCYALLSHCGRFAVRCG